MYRLLHQQLARTVLYFSCTARAGAWQEREHPQHAQHDQPPTAAGAGTAHLRIWWRSGGPGGRGRGRPWHGRAAPRAAAPPQGPAAPPPPACAQQAAISRWHRRARSARCLTTAGLNWNEQLLTRKSSLCRHPCTSECCMPCPAPPTPDCLSLFPPLCCVPKQPAGLSWAGLGTPTWQRAAAGRATRRRTAMSARSWQRPRGSRAAPPAPAGTKQSPRPGALRTDGRAAPSFSF